MLRLGTLQWRCPLCGREPVAIAPALLRCPAGDDFELRAVGTGAGQYWSADRRFEPSGFGSDRQRHLSQLERDSHFWFPARRRLVQTLLGRLFPQGLGSVLELGCGSGHTLTTVAVSARRIVGVDGRQESLVQASELLPQGTFLHADLGDIPLGSGQFDVLLALDVLEHLDPIPFLAEARRLSRPEGRLLVSVPAFPSLWSHVDEAAGHRQRYRLADLGRQLRAAQWDLVGHTYYQFLLFPLVWLSRRLSRRGEPKHEHRPNPTINRLLGSINQLEVGTLGHLSLPFGSSLIAWASPRP